MNPNRDKIGWCDFTWNPVVGCHHWREGICRVGERCYALRQAKRKEHVCKLCYSFFPHMHEERLSEPYQRKKPSRIFVCSMADLFGDFIPVEWIEKVIKVAEDNPRHVFMFLTKNPKRYSEFEFPENCWLGTTVNCQGDIDRVSHLVNKMENVTFISFEPLYGPIRFSNPHHLLYIDWFIIGAQTGPRLLPKKEWIQDLIKVADTYDIAVFLKDNLGELKKEFGDRQEFPDA